MPLLVPGVDTDLLGVKRRECVGGPPAVVLSPRAERDSEEFRFSFSSCGPRMLGSCGVCGAEPAAFTDTDLHIIVIININISVCRPGSVHKKFKKTYPKETSFFYNNQP